MATKMMYKNWHLTNGEINFLNVTESDLSGHDDWICTGSFEISYDDTPPSAEVVYSQLVAKADKQVMDTRIAHEQAIQARKDLDCIDYKPSDDFEVEL